MGGWGAATAGGCVWGEGTATAGRCQRSEPRSLWLESTRKHAAECTVPQGHPEPEPHRAELWHLKGEEGGGRSLPRLPLPFPEEALGLGERCSLLRRRSSLKPLRLRGESGQHPGPWCLVLAPRGPRGWALREFLRVFRAKGRPLPSSLRVCSPRGPAEGDLDLLPRHAGTRPGRQLGAWPCFRGR